jgi:hypothetical protein
VYFLLIRGQREFFLHASAPKLASGRSESSFSYGPSLDTAVAVRRIVCVPDKCLTLLRTSASGVRPVVPVAISTHRFHENIAGHQYQIEVAAVSKDRWRAYIVRIPGVPTALMPFYGPTPREAADLLRQWLTRAYERAGVGTRRI